MLHHPRTFCRLFWNTYISDDMTTSYDVVQKPFNFASFNKTIFGGNWPIKSNLKIIVKVFISELCVYIISRKR